MAKQILIGIEKKKLSEVAHYLVISVPSDQDMRQRHIFPA